VLSPLAPEIRPPHDRHVLDQGQEGACTGFALAAVIDSLNQRRGRDIRVSPRMLYEMARRHDEWPGDDYEGSSLRGAIRGWRNMGVCREELWPYRRQVGRLTVPRAKDARNNTIGAYYRLRPEISDFHAALNEVGAIVVSAQVHSGWDRPRRDRIPFRKRTDGGHAFAVVGYNARGFWVQNSWGADWGDDGLGLWCYEDWIQNVMDAWVVRLALPTPQIFGQRPQSSMVVSSRREQTEEAARTPRAEIAGHFVHIDDGRFKESGHYWSTPEDVGQTAELVARSRKYDHLLFYAHGGLNSPKQSAARIRALKDGFKRNRVYPFHVMYDTGLAEELRDIILRKAREAVQRVGGLTDWTDRLIEGFARRPGTALWNEMKKDARVAFNRGAAGTRCVKSFIDALSASGARSKKIHLAGHSTGGILLAHLLDALSSSEVVIVGCHLMAPACSIELYDDCYYPLLKSRSGTRLRSLGVYNLSDGSERDDNVIGIYRKSLLYLVSNAFEPQQGRPLLGMQCFADRVRGVPGKLTLHYSSPGGRVTRSTSHGGFDNDPWTLNHILQSIIGRKPGSPFTEEELEC
jgi:hypothetical protein